MAENPNPQPEDKILNNEKVEQDRQLILDAKATGTGAKLAAYTRLSGPGWLQSAITLGGGSLAGSLYIGILAGVSLMWLQPLAMILGIVMLSAIGYVAMSTGERPFDAINKHINPVLGWSWLVAAMLANLVWCLPQYALGTAALQQNLFPNLLDGTAGLVVATAFILVVVSVVVWFYNAGGLGIKIFETVLKLMVAGIIISFIGVVVRLSFVEDGVNWGAIFAGFIPDFTLMFRPAESLLEPLAATDDFRQFWANYVIAEQRDVIIAAVATAVGINMTFLMPYAMLSRGWDSDFRGLAIFDLSTGLFIPFLLATSCVIIASATTFHAQPDEVLHEFAHGQISAQEAEAADSGLFDGYRGLLEDRIAHEIGEDQFQALSDEQIADYRNQLPLADKEMAATLVTRDAFNLAASLERFTGPVFAQIIFGLGVLGMAISSIIVLALINGFALCEALNLPSRGVPHRIGSYVVVAFGALGPFIWAGASFYLAVPASVFGMMLIPIAYITFALMMNQKSLLGEHLPTGGRRVLWNVLMGIAIILASLGAFWAIATRTGPFPLIGIEQRWVAFFIIIVLVIVGIVIHFRRKAAAPPAETADQ